MGASNWPVTTVMPQVTRIEVIDATGRAFGAYYAAGDVSLQLQDGTRTLKIFAGNPQSVEEWQDSR